MSFDLSFYKGKRVFVTGHTGFKGSWLCKILANAGAIVTGYSLNPPTTPSLFEIASIEQDVHSVIGDIRDYKALKAAFDEAQPEIVLHLAAQPNGNGFKARIRDGIESTIRTKYLSDESHYATGDALADDQNKFYVIAQDEDYQPFAYLSLPEEQVESFRIEDKDNADALLFKFILQRTGHIKQFWAYQKILPSSIPNKKKQHFQLVPKSEERPDVFKELTDQMFIITQKVDLLVLLSEAEANEPALGEIITDEIKLMERHFGLETFVRASAERAAGAITTVGLVKNVDKLQEYVQRQNKKYAKKMMQIHKFPVATMSKAGLVERLLTVERWRGVFEIQEEQVYLRNYTDVENIIDLFTERYTKSEVTGQEYDTEVKNKAEPRAITA